MDGYVSLPCRVRLPDFSGRLLSLPDAPEAWSCRGHGDAVLLLGLGPGAVQNLPFLAGASAVYWLESPRVFSAVRCWRNGEGTGNAGPLPDHWREISPEAVPELAAHCRCWFYTPGLRLDPAFWGPLLGAVDAAQCAPRIGGFVPLAGERAAMRGPVLLPGDDGRLLHQELRTALTQCGFGPVLDTPPQPLAASCGGKAADDFAARWRGYLGENRPVFLLSVNLRGLDAEGRVFHLCRALGIPVALWFVDNPWHVLAGVRLPWWREAHIFVTDAGFVESLRALGAQKVFHLPLAVAPHMWREMEEAPEQPLEPPLFVGRSAFPEKERFFAAARVPQSLEEEAAHVLASSVGPGDAPNFFWWRDRLGGTLWPGHEVRRMGLGAERCAQANRARWLRAARAGSSGGLRVVGDDGWKALLPGAVIMPPVDYYTALPVLYARAEAVLNVTSLLMPGSLSQRHFDVWACGGLLLSDATVGLEIFPAELTGPMVLAGPDDVLEKCAWFRAHPHEGLRLRRAWRAHLRARHSYAHRIGTLLEALFAG